MANQLRNMELTLTNLEYSQISDNIMQYIYSPLKVTHTQTYIDTHIPILNARPRTFPSFIDHSLNIPQTFLKHSIYSLNIPHIP